MIRPKIGVGLVLKLFLAVVLVGVVTLAVILVRTGSKPDLEGQTYEEISSKFEDYRTSEVAAVQQAIKDGKYVYSSGSEGQLLEVASKYLSTGNYAAAEEILKLIPDTARGQVVVVKYQSLIRVYIGLGRSGEYASARLQLLNALEFAKTDLSYLSLLEKFDELYPEKMPTISQTEVTETGDQ